jgi:hypothetical protein
MYVTDERRNGDELSNVALLGSYIKSLTNLRTNI